MQPGQGEAQMRVLEAILSQPQQMAGMSHAELYQMRSRAPMDAQNTIAPYEHQAFAREAVGENPFMALPIATAIPMYQVYKAIMGSRSQPSFDQVTHGMQGVGEGLVNYFRK